MVLHVDIGKHKESWHKPLEGTMVGERDRSGRKKFDWVDMESKGLVVAAGTDIAGPPKLASQRY
jgi:hypothetical protein